MSVCCSGSAAALDLFLLLVQAGLLMSSGAAGNTEIHSEWKSLRAEYELNCQKYSRHGFKETKHGFDFLNGLINKCAQ